MRIYALLCYNFKIRGNILQGGSNINNYDISKSYEDSLSTYDKKTQGIYYTPKTIVSYILNNEKYSDKRKVILSFTSIIGILLIGFIIFYLEYGNILNVIKNLDPSEIIASFSYIGMGVGLASIYANNGDLLRNIGIHATVNAIALIILFFK